jgi:protein phosphatase
LSHEEHGARRKRPGPPAALRVDIAGVTDVGRLRQRNEDAIDWDARLGMAMVADGMGGTRGGDIAAATALRSVREDLRRALADAQRRGGALGREARAALVAELVRRANRMVRDSAAGDDKLNGMGTTLVLALLGADCLTVAHVGDSRLYRLRAGQLTRLTDDHSMVQEMVERGQMDRQQAERSRHRNVITRALGIGPDVTVDVAHHPVEPGDVYMLCSDGLTNMAPEADIAATLTEHAHNLQTAAHNAVNLANARGGRDNVSVVLMRISGAADG